MNISTMLLSVCCMCLCCQTTPQRVKYHQQIFPVPPFCKLPHSRASVAGFSSILFPRPVNSSSARCTANNRLPCTFYTAHLHITCTLLHTTPDEQNEPMRGLRTSSVARPTYVSCVSSVLSVRYVRDVYARKVFKIDTPQTTRRDQRET